MKRAFIVSEGLAPELALTSSTSNFKIIWCVVNMYGTVTRKKGNEGQFTD